MEVLELLVFLASLELFLALFEFSFVDPFLVESGVF